MSNEFIDALIECANEVDPIDLTHVEHSRFLRDLDAPVVVVLWLGSVDGKVRWWAAKGTPHANVINSIAAFWLEQPDAGFRIVDSPNGPTLEVFEQRQRPDGKLEVIGPTECTDCRMKTGIRGEWYIVHDHVWQQAWPGAEWLAGESADFMCEEILCVGCLEKGIGRQLTPDDFPRGWDGIPTYKSKRLRNRAYGAAAGTR